MDFSANAALEIKWPICHFGQKLSPNKHSFLWLKVFRLIISINVKIHSFILNRMGDKKEMAKCHLKTKTWRQKWFLSQPVSIFENKIDRQNRLTFFLVLIDVDHRVVVGVVVVLPPLLLILVKVGLGLRQVAGNRDEDLGVWGKRYSSSRTQLKDSKVRLVLLQYFRLCY